MADIFDLFRQISKSEPSRKEPVGWLIAGLGNPGAKYRLTRHNAGFLAIDYLAEKVGAQTDRLRFQAFTGEAVIAGQRVLLMKPQTMMNASGDAVGEAASFYKIPPEHVLVLSDDITLAPGLLRARKKGSAGGHNGLKSIIAHLGSEDFPRVRIGIGEKPHPDFDLADWVLSEFTKPEQESLFEAFGRLADGVEKILSGDFDNAMQICNSNPQKGNS